MHYQSKRIRETSFSMTYGAKTMSPVEVGVPSPLRIHFDEIANDELMKYELKFFEKMRDDSQIKLAMYQCKMTNYYNNMVKKMAFCIGDLVLRNVFLSLKELSIGTLGPNW